MVLFLTNLLTNFSLFAVPPRPPNIMWAGRPIVGAVGPLKEGQEIDLTCEAAGGHPAPRVTWWRGSQQLTSHQGTGPVDPTLVWAVASVVASRKSAAVPLVCQVESPQVDDLPPQTTSIQLNVTRKLNFNFCKKNTFSKKKENFDICSLFLF